MIKEVHQERGICMEYRNEVLCKNLDLLYKTQIAALACLVLMLIPIINIIALVAALGAGIMSVSAMIALRTIHPDYKNAIVATVVAFILQFLFGNSDGIFGAMISVAGSIAGLFQTYFIIQATSSLLGEINREDLVELGQRVWKITWISAAVSVVADLMTELLPFLGVVLGLIMMIAALILSVVAMVKFMGYLKAGSQAFEKQTALPEL